MKDQIIADIFQLTDPPINPGRKEEIRRFIDTSINGDEPRAHLVINASLGKDKKGAIVYILTDLRLIKIDIEEKGIQSSSFLLNSILNVERKLTEENRAHVLIAFQDNSIGLRYPASDETITEFFQKVDKARPRT